MDPRRLFFTANERLRAPWRIVIFLIAVVAAGYVASTVGSMLISTAGAFGVRLIVFSWVSLAALLVAHYVSLHWVDGLSWNFVWLNCGAARPMLLVTGAIFGAGAIGIPSLLLLATGELRAVPAIPGSWWGAALHSALLLLPAALTEELLLRGYIFAVLRESAGWKWALIATSIVFGLLHVQNPGVTPESVVLVMVAGFFLGTIVLVTESLYAAWMAHFAWNWVMAGALHTAVSGLGIATPNYRVIDSGPDWLTGGAWGPEGGLAAGLGMFVCLFYLYGRNLSRLEKK